MTTLGIGLGLVAVVFTVLNAFVFQVDEVRNPHELFAISRAPSNNVEPAPFARTDYEALLRDTSVFSEAFASMGFRGWVEGTSRDGTLVTGNFFQVVGVGALRGRLFTLEDDEPGAAPVIVLSYRAWTRYFASDPGAIGRTVRVDGRPVDIVGVTPDGFRGLEPVAAPDFWAPLSILEQLRPQATGQAPIGLQVTGRLNPDLSPDQALARLLTWDSLRAAELPVEERPVASLVLEPSDGTVPLSTDTMLLFVPLFFAFGLILAIGCANVANLLLARGIARRREIGIRLAIGASRARVVSQLLAESLLLALVSAALAFFFSRILLRVVIRAVTSTFPPDMGNLRLGMPAADWRLVLFLVAGAIVSTLFFGLAPALRAARPELVRAIRGEGMGVERPGRARNVFIALQVTASVLLLICAAVFLRSTWTAASIDSGLRTDGIVNVAILDEERRLAVLDAVNSEPSVASIAASWPGWVNEPIGGLPALAEGAAGESTVTYQFVSPEYFDVLGIDLVRGRAFTQRESNATEAVAIVSEAVARELWPDTDAIGQVVRVEPSLLREPQPDNLLRTPRTAAVIGIARDVEGFRLLGARLGATGVYLPVAADAAMTSLTLAVRGNAEAVRRTLVDRFAAIDPNMTQVSTLQSLSRAEAYLLGIPFWLTLVLGSLALFFTLSGLYSVLSYAVEQRTREIGVRAALGATPARIGALVLSHCARPVGIGLLIGSGLVASLGAALLATPAAELVGSTVSLLDPIAYGASLVCVVGGCAAAALIPALRAGWIDPVTALRQD